MEPNDKVTTIIDAAKLIQRDLDTAQAGHDAALENLQRKKEEVAAREERIAELIREKNELASLLEDKDAEILQLRGTIQRQLDAADGMQPVSGMPESTNPNAVPMGAEPPAEPEPIELPPILNDAQFGEAVPAKPKSKRRGH